jgi:G:T-mismatch repair DNA endonuclease (very short patch repair protein)
LPVEYKEKLSQIHKQMVEEGKQKNLFKVGFDSRRIKTQFKKGHDPRRGRLFSSEYNPMFNQKLKDKARKNSLMSQHKRPTKPEQILIDLIQQNQLPYKYVGNGEVLFGGKNPDFIQVNGKKKLIEIFGSYWHKNDNPKERIDFFKNYGFSTLIIWDKELENPQNVVNKIKVFDNE